MPLLWVNQHDRTAAQPTRLRLELEQLSARETAARTAFLRPMKRPLQARNRPVSTAGGTPKKILQILWKPFLSEGDTP